MIAHHLLHARFSFKSAGILALALFLCPDSRAPGAESTGKIGESKPVGNGRSAAVLLQQALSAAKAASDADQPLERADIRGVPAKMPVADSPGLLPSPDAFPDDAPRATTVQARPPGATWSATGIGRTTLPVMCGALAEGASRARNVADSADCRATRRIVEALGARVLDVAPGEVRIEGPGLAGLTEPADVLDAANSGTTTRLGAGILATRPFYSVITGDASLRSRPMRRIVEPLTAMGATILGRHGGSRLPLSIQGGRLRILLSQGHPPLQCCGHRLAAVVGDRERRPAAQCLHQRPVGGCVRQRRGRAHSILLSIVLPGGLDISDQRRRKAREPRPDRLNRDHGIAPDWDQRRIVQPGGGAVNDHGFPVDRGIAALQFDPRWPVRKQVHERFAAFIRHSCPQNSIDHVAQRSFAATWRRLSACAQSGDAERSYAACIGRLQVESRYASL